MRSNISLFLFFIHFYSAQAQDFFRLGPGSHAPGLIAVFRHDPVDRFTYRPTGMFGLREEKGALLLFDKRNSLQKARVAGMNFLFTERESLTTFSKDGFIFYKGGGWSTPRISGGNWWIDPTHRTLRTVNSGGGVMDSEIQVTGVRVGGGNYLIRSDGTLITIDSEGRITQKVGWDFSDVRRAGGNFFMRESGVLVTLNEQNGFFNDGIQVDSRPWLLGGTYFIGQDRFLYTIDREGRVFKNTDFRVEQTPSFLGYGFFKTHQGQLIAMDSKGIPHSQVLRISTSGIRVSVLRTLEAELDPHSVFIPWVQGEREGE